MGGWVGGWVGAWTHGWMDRVFIDVGGCWNGGVDVCE